MGDFGFAGLGFTDVGGQSGLSRLFPTTRTPITAKRESRHRQGRQTGKMKVAIPGMNDYGRDPIMSGVGGYIGVPARSDTGGYMGASEMSAINTWVPSMSGTGDFMGAPGTSGIGGFMVAPSMMGTGGYLAAPWMSGMGGYHGVPGTSGMGGYPGVPGMSGMGGYPGVPGMWGYPGVPGMSGMGGYPGVPGTGGYPGVSGMSGMSGYMEVPGMWGYPGVPGTSGMGGYPGVPGMWGYPGAPGMNSMWGHIGISSGMQVPGMPAVGTAMGSTQPMMAIPGVFGAAGDVGAGVGGLGVPLLQNSSTTPLPLDMASLGVPLKASDISGSPFSGASRSDVFGIQTAPDRTASNPEILMNTIREAKAAGLKAQDIAAALRQAIAEGKVSIQTPTVTIAPAVDQSAPMPDGTKSPGGMQKKASEVKVKEETKKSEVKKAAVKPPSAPTKPPPKKKAGSTAEAKKKEILKNRKIPWDPLLEKQGTAFAHMIPSQLAVTPEGVTYEFSLESRVPEGEDQNAPKLAKKTYQKFLPDQKRAYNMSIAISRISKSGLDKLKTAVQSLNTEVYIS
eukprot:Gregarina_sp_Poly_1__184@NODE_1043_length_5264_cov_29_231672_g723_i0_p1_GENE_NODE_1043_length_5264_cov_29_231672_g723_i0NODE_1043_length_5264_cov_29_231672_g723_i0_p1_ORF_typecomplete_len563_score70_00Collagen/PF01391_18/0_028Collagen/PF01391_18/6_7e06Collagen/PF01391_18/2_3e03FH2/PF02181_23/0_014_NODE_1043_length_5264_cov_29_231672_g723_i019163604